MTKNSLDKSYRLQFDAKARQLVGQMSLEEKVYLMSGRDETLLAGKERYNLHPYHSGGNQRLGLPDVTFADGPRGVVVGNSTAFPVAMLRGATFDTDLEEAVGVAIGKEVRAQGGNLFAGVCINLPYNPGWGRSQEVYGEDNFALGSMASALIRGVQSQYVMACVKHFAFNSMENARFTVNVTASRRTEREQYLSHFKDAVDAGAASIMSSYNHYAGSYAGHSDYLLNKVLKGEWGFDGFVMSDFIWGVNDTVEAATGGQDMEMMRTKYFGPRLVEAVRAGQVPEKFIDEAALRIVRTTLAFTEGAPQIDPAVVACKEHTDLARKVAEEGITLLKNESVLPLAKSLGKLLVVGKLAQSDNIGDHGSSRVYPPYAVSPLDGLKAEFPDTEVIYSQSDDIEATKALAEQVDAVVFVVGYDYNDEGEYVSNDLSDEQVVNDASDADTTGFAKGGDRSSLALHQPDIDLIKAVGPVNSASVVVLIGGNTIVVHEWQDKVKAIVEAYYPGMEGGNALARILSGAVNPSGKLPFAIPADERDLPSVDWQGRQVEYGYLHGYNKLETEHRAQDFSFGYGLSYTSFELSQPVVSRQGQQIQVTARVSNTGQRDGAEVVQVYIGFDNSALAHPHKELKGFRKVFVPAGESREVKITIPLAKLAYFDEAKNDFVLEPITYDVYVGTSSADAESRHSLLAVD